MMKSHKKKEDPELPGGIRTWNQMYALVIGNLLILIVLFFLFTKFFE